MIPQFLLSKAYRSSPDNVAAVPGYENNQSCNKNIQMTEIQIILIQPSRRAHVGEISGKFFDFVDKGCRMGLLAAGRRVHCGPHARGFVPYRCPMGARPWSTGRARIHERGAHSGLLWTRRQLPQSAAFGRQNQELPRFNFHFNAFLRCRPSNVILAKPTHEARIALAPPTPPSIHAASMSFSAHVLNRPAIVPIIATA